MRPPRARLGWVLVITAITVAAGPAAAAAPLGAAAPPSPVAADTPYVSLEHYRLDNGLNVVLCRMQTPLVTVVASYRVGSAQDPPGRSGLAHLVEHLAFRGTEHIPVAARDKALSAADALEHSGGTDWEWTEYWTTLPSANVEVPLWLESDRMGFLARALDGRVLAVERDVVIQERHERLDDVLESRAHEELFAALFPSAHPYHRPPGGVVREIEELDFSDSREFVRKWYQPSNAVLTVIGGFEPRRVRALIQRYFGSLESAPTPRHQPIPTVAAGGERTQTQSEADPSTRVHVGWPVPAIFAEGDAEAALLGWMLTNRLERRVTDSALDGAVWYFGLGGQSLLLASLVAPPTTPADQVLAWVDAELADLATQRPSDLELRRALELLETNFFSSVDGASGLVEWGRVLRDYVFYLGDADRLHWDLARYRQVSPESLSRFVGRLREARNRMVLVTPAPPPASTSTGIQGSP